MSRPSGLQHRTDDGAIGTTAPGELSESVRGGTLPGPRRRSSPPVPGPRGPLRFILPVRTRTILGWEVGLLVVAVVYVADPGRTTLTGRIAFPVLAGLVVLGILATSVRAGRLTVIERLARGRELRARTRQARAGSDADSVQQRLLPGLTLNTHIDRAGNRTGLIGTGLEWSATIKVSDSVVPDPEALIAAATRACRRSDLPLAAAQVLSQNLPASWSGAAAGSGTATLRQFFLSVRVADQPTGQAGRARGGGPSGLQRAAASAAAALAFDLTQLGYPCSVLDGAELEQQVQLLSGTVGAEPAGTAELLETAHHWAAGRIEQTCLYPGAGTSSSDALIWTVTQPLSFVIASVTLTPTVAVNAPNPVDRHFVVRVGMLAQPGPLTIVQAARALDRRLSVAAYRQQAEVRASLPLALGPIH